MKKVQIVFLLFIALTFLNACKKEDSLSLIEKLNEYQEKIAEIIENDKSENELISLGVTNLESSIYDDPFMLPKEDYLEVYNKQRDNQTDVQLDPILMQYKLLLDEVILKLNENDIEMVIAEIELDVRGFFNLDAYVELLSSGEILIRLSVEVAEYSYYSGLKIGYEEDDFYLIELTKASDTNSFEYIEFLENNHVINIRYNQNAYWYRYQNQNDNTLYEIAEATEFESTSFILRWFNPETNVRTLISIGGEGNFHNFELFNEKGIYFSYFEDFDTELISVAWQLLEADGWDYIYHENNKNNPLNGIYSNGEKLFSDAKVNLDLGQRFANVRLEYKMTKEELTNSHLDLSYYGLSFNYPDLDLETLENIKSNALDESAYLSIYKGIDFLNDDLSNELYDAIDDDVKPVN
jgi:hypothetical protein